MFDVFVCHASGDKPVANAIVERLETRGIKCWIAPRNVTPGSDYAQAIVQGISNSNLLLLVHTAEANNSPHVRREVERAASRDIPILPFRVDEITLSPSLEYFISSAHWFDATTPPVDQHLDRLADALVERLGVGSPGAGDVPDTDPSGMSNVPRNHLAEFVSRFGPELADDPRRVQALLRDTAGEYRSEIAVLVAAAQEGVGATLLSSSEGMVGSTAARLVNQLQANRAIQTSAAEWAVLAWAQALGVPVEISRPPPRPDHSVPPGPTPEPQHEPTQAVGGSAPQDAPTHGTTPEPSGSQPPVSSEATPPQYSPPPRPPQPPPIRAQPAGNGGSRTPLIIGVVAIVALVFGGIVIAALALRGDDNGSSSGGPTTLLGATSEVFLEPSDDQGADPFTESVAVIPAVFRRDLLPQPEPAEDAPVEGAIQAVSGDQVGLYGGTRDNSSCDAEQMIAFLNQNADKGLAWANTQGIDTSDLGSFISGLTPLLLTQDTRVTNHGFRSGVASARQSILEAGTAVLVDQFGTPRARCACGNPLVEPTPVSAPSYVGQAWNDFDPTSIAVIIAAANPIADFVLRNVADGTAFERPAGSRGANDRASSVTLPGTAGSATTTTSTGPRSTVVVTLDRSNLSEAQGLGVLDIEGDVQVTFATIGNLGTGETLVVENVSGSIDIRASGPDPDLGCTVDVYQRGRFMPSDTGASGTGGRVSLMGITPVETGLNPANTCPDEQNVFPITVDEPWSLTWDSATGVVSGTMAGIDIGGFAEVIPDGGSPTTTVATEAMNVTGEGTAVATSVFSGDFPVNLATDGDTTTSWFSAGPDADGTSTFAWMGRQDDLITQVDIVSNAAHSVADFRTGFGFETATVLVLDANLNTVFSETVPLAGSPDPNIRVFPNVIGRQIAIVFSGHEDATCGGFSELIVTAARPAG